ncbi:MAG: hypothetical protein ACK6DC_04370, partial [Planctomycetota bacterium]
MNVPVQNRFRGWFPVWALMLVMIPDGGLRGQDPTATRWPELIQQAEASLTPDKIPSSAVHRQQAESSLRNLESFLATTPEQGAAGRAFFNRAAAGATMAEEQPHLGVLYEIEKRFRQNYAGLEMGPFVQARDAMARYV